MKSYFVSFTCEVFGTDGRISWWPNSRIIRGQHPLEWFASTVKKSVNGMAIVWWKELTDEEAAIDGQVIVEDASTFS